MKGRLSRDQFINETSAPMHYILVDDLKDTEIQLFEKWLKENMDDWYYIQDNYIVIPSKDIMVAFLLAFSNMLRIDIRGEL